MANAQFSDLIKSQTPTLVDFHADWCGPCHMMKPILEKLKSDVGEGVRIIKIDIDRNQTVANAFHVQSVPTLALFKDGQIKWIQSGVRQVEELKRVIQEFGT